MSSDIWGGVSVREHEGVCWLLWCVGVATRAFVDIWHMYMPVQAVRCVCVSFYFLIGSICGVYYMVRRRFFEAAGRITETDRQTGTGGAL